MTRPRRSRRIAPVPCALALALAGAALPAADEPEEGRRYALVVGVQNYEGTGLGNLKYCDNDAAGLAEVLGKRGYRVTLLTRPEWKAKDGRDDLLPTADNIRDHLKAVLKNRRPADTVLLAFAGHGEQLKKDGKMYFCPAKGDLDRPETLISLDWIYELLKTHEGEKDHEAGTKVLIVDACRNDPLAGRAVGSEKLESVTRPELPEPPGGTVALFGCSKGEMAYESEALKHGFLFHFVIEGLGGKAASKKDGRITWLGLARHVDDELSDAVHVELGPKAVQTPEVRGEARGLVLARLDGGSPPPDATTTEAGARPAPLDCTGETGAGLTALLQVRQTQARWATYLGRERDEEDEVAPGVKMRFLLVPPGKFLMGSPKEEKGRSDLEVQHEVEITRPFYLGAYDVTQEQYEAVTGKTPSDFKGADLPVENVNWEEADAFAKSLTEKAKDGLVYRLPSEAEWEYACRGGRSSSYPFGIGDGASLSSREANFDGGHPYGGAERGPNLEKTSPVGSYKANALGLYDMQGNVWQWCSDWYGEYPSGKATDPTGPAPSSSRIFRGGSWSYGADRCRAADRNGYAPDLRSRDLSFRLVRIPSGMGK